MGKIADIFGRLARSASGFERQAALVAGSPQPPRAIPGGAARELCMLPTDGDFAMIGGGPKRLVELKADGIRGLYLDGRIVTREGVAMDCALHCQPALARLEEAFGERMFFDGEYVAEDGFNATIAEFRKGFGNGVLWLFDAVPLDVWMHPGCDTEPLDVRKAALKALAPAADSPFVGVLDHWMLDHRETEAKFRELVLEGYEGVVSKNPLSMYHRARVSEWLRFKATTTVDGAIVDVLARDGTLRKIMVRGPDGPPVAVAAGWSREQGQEIARAFVRGQPLVAEITFEMSTGAKRSIRGARFNRLRPDKVKS